MSVYVANESGIEVDEVGLVALARHVLSTMNVSPLAELSVMLYGKDAMTRLHEQYMQEDGPTDVLAFPQDDLSTNAPMTAGEDLPEALLGDVVLCPEVAEGQARTAGHTLDDELHLLCTHGILHLLGYDHAEPEDERRMFATQRQLLESWRSAAFGNPAASGEAPS
jgi:probable rRNA maturation factor